MSKPEIFGGNVNQGRPHQEIVQETVRGAKVTPVVERITASEELPPEPRPTIKYLLGGPDGDQY